MCCICGKASRKPTQAFLFCSCEMTFGLPQNSKAFILLFWTPNRMSPISRTIPPHLPPRNSKRWSGRSRQRPWTSGGPWPKHSCCHTRPVPRRLRRPSLDCRSEPKSWRSIIWPQRHLPWYFFWLFSLRNQVYSI